MLGCLRSCSEHCIDLSRDAAATFDLLTNDVGKNLLALLVALAVVTFLVLVACS